MLGHWQAVCLAESSPMLGAINGRTYLRLACSTALLLPWYFVINTISVLFKYIDFYGLWHANLWLGTRCTIKHSRYIKTFFPYLIFPRSTDWPVPPRSRQWIISAWNFVVFERTETVYCCSCSIRFILHEFLGMW